MLLRYLEPVKLLKATKVKQPNGSFINEYEEVSDYKVQKQTVESEIDAQVYGAEITKMLRLTSPYNKLEQYLLDKLNNTEDNISKYYISDNNVKYKIKAVTPYKVDIERI